MSETDYYGIGIDLGTTNSCIAVFKNGGIEIIPNKNGEKTTPSLIIIKENGEILLGEETYDFLINNYNKDIFELKYYSKNNNINYQNGKEIYKLPLKINIFNLKDFPEININININGKIINYKNFELYSLIIKKLISNAENYLNRKITKIIVNCSAYSYDIQKNFIKKANELLGVGILEIMPAYKAALLAYQFNKVIQIDKNKKKKYISF